MHIERESKYTAVLPESSVEACCFFLKAEGFAMHARVCVCVCVCVCLSVNGTQWFWQDSMFTISFLLVYLSVHLFVALVLGWWFVVARNKDSLSWLQVHKGCF